MCIDFSKKYLYNYDSVIVVTRRSLRFNVSASNQNPLKRRYGVSFCLFIRKVRLGEGNKKNSPNEWTKQKNVYQK